MSYSQNAKQEIPPKDILDVIKRMSEDAFQFLLQNQEMTLRMSQSLMEFQSKLLSSIYGLYSSNPEAFRQLFPQDVNQNAGYQDVYKNFMNQWSQNFPNWTKQFAKNSPDGLSAWTEYWNKWAPHNQAKS